MAIRLVEPEDSTLIGGIDVPESNPLSGSRG